MNETHHPPSLMHRAASRLPLENQQAQVHANSRFYPEKEEDVKEENAMYRQPSSGKEEEEIFKAGFDSNSEEDSKCKEGDQDIP